MRLKFLGTGAADWITPTPGDEQRHLTSTLIDDELLIDFGMNAAETITDAAAIKNVLITHSHIDHFYAESIVRLAPVNLYVDKSWADGVQINGATVISIQPGESFDAAGYCITPCRGNHSEAGDGGQVLHYLIEKDGKRIYYALDGAWLTYEETRLLKDNPVDAIVIDATIGDGHDGDYRVFVHNSLPMVRIMVDTLSKDGMLKPGAPVYLTHLARTLHGSQAELEAANPAPYVVCKDGLTAEV